MWYPWRYKFRSLRETQETRGEASRIDGLVEDIEYIAYQIKWIVKGW